MKKMFFVSILTMMFAASTYAADSKVMITGAGATFPAPLYTKWFSDYNKTNPNIEINYQSIGSGGGIKQLITKTVDFGASDAPMSDEELKSAGSPVVHIPTVLGAVVLVYNTPGMKTPIKLTGEVISEIYQGKITKWNDAKIASLNKGISLPKDSIIPVYRSDSSGTTAVFTDYLGKVSSTWKSSVGSGKAVKWPTGLGGKGNEGVAASVKNTPGAIGYVELTYADSTGLPMAQIQSQSGTFVTASTKSVSEAAATSLKDMPSDFRVSITDAPGKNSYPISSFTYLLVYSQGEGPKAKELVKFLNWALTEGQKSAPTLKYAPLPAAMVKKVKDKIASIKVQ